MPRRIQTSVTKGRRQTITAIGDSLTHNISLGVRPDEFWPEQLAAGLRVDGYAVKARNFGISGNTTTQMLARVAELTMFDTPAIAVIFGGVNDPGGGISSATTTANVRAMIRYLKNGATGVVSGQGSLPSSQRAGVRYVVTDDTSTTGGVLPGLAGTQAGVQVWESRNALAGESGWGRVADLAAADRPVNRFVVVGPQFLNYTAGGDTVGASGSHSGQGATYAAVHSAVQSAASAEGAAFCDLYAYMQDRIIDGYDAANTASWHVAGTNQHLNPYGEQLVALAVREVIDAQATWRDALR